MVKCIQSQSWIFLDQNSLNFEDFVRNFSQFFTGIFIGSIIEERRLIKRLGNILIAVESIRNRRMPNTVDIHERHSQKIIRRVKLREFSNEFMKKFCDRLLGGSLLGRNDDLDFFLRSQHLDARTILHNSACPRQSLEGKETGIANEVAAEIVNGTQVKSSFSGHGADGHSFFQEGFESLEVHLVSEARKSKDYEIQIAWNFFGFVGDEVWFAVDVFAEVIDASDSFGWDGVAEFFRLSGEEGENRDVCVGFG
mmetsp:Transcript_17602/g.36985  ORF Transcript_17602/g.36985 Transcript_17602/m.36985 type:complete len:253 (+) Transcript_17602:569-1327(+)